MSCIVAHGLEQRDFVEFEKALYQSVTKEKKYKEKKQYKEKSTNYTGRCNQPMMIPIHKSFAISFSAFPFLEETPNFLHLLGQLLHQ